MKLLSFFLSVFGFILILLNVHNVLNYWDIVGVLCLMCSLLLIFLNSTLSKNLIVIISVVYIFGVHETARILNDKLTEYLIEKKGSSALARVEEHKKFIGVNNMRAIIKYTTETEDTIIQTILDNDRVFKDGDTIRVRYSKTYPDMFRLCQAQTGRCWQ